MKLRGFRNHIGTILAATLIFSSGVLSAAGNANAVATMTWTEQNVPTDAPTNRWTSITYGNGTFVAVSRTGTHRVMTSTDGITWTGHVVPTMDWRHVMFANGTFVASGASGQLMTSTDGISWSSRTSGATSRLSAMTYGADQFVSLVGSSSSILTSPDGISWTLQSTGLTNLVWNAITYGGPAGQEKFVVVGGAGSIATSPDGITWTAVGNGLGIYWTSVIYRGIPGMEKFVAIGQYGDVMTSTDGTTWTLDTSLRTNQDPNNPDGPWMNVVTYGNGKYVAVADSGIVFSSQNALTWTSETPVDTNADWPSVVYGDGLFVALADNGKIMTSGTFAGGNQQQQTPPPNNTPSNNAPSNNTPSNSNSSTNTPTTDNTGATANSPTSPGVTVTDPTVYATPPRRVADQSAITVLSQSQTRTQRLRTATPAICLTTNDDIVFIDEGRCNVSVLNKKTGDVLRRLNTTVIDSDVVELGIGNEIATLAPIYFSNGSSVLTNTARKQIATLEDRISAAGTVLVTGHTGIMTGNTAENRTLSQSRSVNTVREMKRIGATGPFYSVAVGAADPEVKNTERSAQAKNRRVVIILVP